MQGLGELNDPGQAVSQAWCLVSAQLDVSCCCYYGNHDLCVLFPHGENVDGSHQIITGPVTLSGLRPPTLQGSVAQDLIVRLKGQARACQASLWTGGLEARRSASLLKPGPICPCSAQAPSSGPASVYLLSFLLQASRAKARPDASLSRRRIQGSLAVGGRLGVLGLEWRSVSSCFSLGKKNKPLTFSGAARLAFFSGTLQPCQVAQAGPQGQGSGSRLVIWTSVPCRNILEHSLAGSRH